LSSNSAPDSNPGPTPGVTHYEYVFPDGEIDVFDIDHDHRLVKKILVPEATIIRGMAGHAASRMLYIAGWGATQADAYILKYDLVADRPVWKQLYPPMVDSLCITPDGKKLYVPNGTGVTTRVVDTDSGQVLASIATSEGAHNSICTFDGKRVYVGGLTSTMMSVISTADYSVRPLGPFGGSVRPFTIDVPEHYVFANVNGLLGFEAADAQSGVVLYRVSPPGYPFTSMPNYTQSHGVAMSPDGKEVWVVDQPYNRVHGFDVTGLPGRAPTMIADIALQGSLRGAESGSQGKEGWLSFNRDGRYLYVGDAGDVIETARRAIVAHLDALANTRKFLEIDFEGGVPVWVAPRSTQGGMPVN